MIVIIKTFIQIEWKSMIYQKRLANIFLYHLNLPPIASSVQLAVKGSHPVKLLTTSGCKFIMGCQ